MPTPIRVVVAEDSSTHRALLLAILQSDPDVIVVGEARTGAEAVELARRLRPDVITMDIQMPVMDGLAATEAIMRQVPTPIVVVSSTQPADVDLSVAATGAGAVLVLEKPPGPHAPSFDEYRGRFLAMVKAMAQVKVVRRWTPLSGRAVTDPHRATPPASRAGVHANVRNGVPAVGHAPVRISARARVVAIAASTGGPAALCRVLRELPRDFPAPLLVVQHIAAGFVDGLAHWLAGECRVRVKVAEHGERLTPATVYLAPDGRHLATAGDTVVLSDAAVVGGFRPAATVLFAAVARSHGARAVAVILTGMGSDGVEGLGAVRGAGGHVIAQDEASSIVYGMPKEAVRAGVVGEVLPPEEIGERLIQLVSGEST
jgi:two-component system chemotaxis response regulator CheB